MKKFLKIVLIIIILVLIIITGLVVYNKIATHMDKKALQNSYGKKIALACGDAINVCEYGSGDKTIVVLPGFGSVSPAMEYKGLAMEMPDYHFVVFEPFGYGLSDITDIPRTSDNICDEVHETLDILGLNHYTLMAHSVSGLYSMNYLNKYRNEIDGFIGIDVSYYGMDSSESEQLISSLKSANVLNNMGIIRILSIASKDEEIILPQLLDLLNENEIRICRRLSYFNSVNSDLIDEAKHMDKNTEKIKEMSFPKNLKVQLYVSGENCKDTPDWEQGHKKLINDCIDASCEILDGGHYLHLDCTKELAEKIIKRMQ